MNRNKGNGAWLVGTFTLLALATGQASAQAPQIGQVQRLTVITVSMQVGSTGHETKRVSYVPPPGWYVRGHAVNCQQKLGNSSYTVNTVPQNWAFVTEDKINESYKALLDLAGEAQHAGLKANFKMEQEQLLAEVRKVRSSHHALVLDATANGEGFLRSGGALQLTITAELVYVGTEESLTSHIARHKSKLK